MRNSWVVWFSGCCYFVHFIYSKSFHSEANKFGSLASDGGCAFNKVLEMYVGAGCVIFIRQPKVFIFFPWVHAGPPIYILNGPFRTKNPWYSRKASFPFPDATLCPFVVRRVRIFLRVFGQETLLMQSSWHYCVLPSCYHLWLQVFFVSPVFQ